MSTSVEASGEPVSMARSSESHDNRVFPSASRDHGDDYDREGSGHQRRQISRSEEEGVEVVLESRGKSTVVDSSVDRPSLDQNVFRPPHPVRPRAVRAQHGPPPHVKSSGSYGYGHPPPHSEYGHRPYPVPSYNPSGSFDDGSYHGHAPPPSHSHYSPHVQYPPPGARHPPEDVNVISPNHKGDHRGPPMTPRRYGGASHHYQYPPTSPVSRPGAPPTTSPPLGWLSHSGSISATVGCRVFL
jgi:hypothetical protein